MLWIETKDFICHCFWIAAETGGRGGRFNLIKLRDLTEFTVLKSGEGSLRRILIQLIILCFSGI